APGSSAPFPGPCLGRCPTPPLVRSALDLPFRPVKPRATGITMVIDNGLPTGAFRDHIASTAPLIDVVKFGWGTVVATPDIGAKIAVLEEHGIDFFFGGTLTRRTPART